MPDTEQNEVVVATDLVRIIRENKNLKAKPLIFYQRDNQLMTRNALEEWLEEIEGEFCFFTNNSRKEIEWLKKSLWNPTGEFAVMCRAASKDKHLKSDQKQPKNREWLKQVKKTA